MPEPKAMIIKNSAMIPRSPNRSSVTPIVLHPKMVSSVSATMNTFFRDITSPLECTIMGMLSTSHGFTTMHSSTHAIKTPRAQNGRPTATQVPKDIVKPAFCGRGHRGGERGARGRGGQRGARWHTRGVPPDYGERGRGSSYLYTCCVFDGEDRQDTQGHTVGFISSPLDSVLPLLYSPRSTCLACKGDKQNAAEFAGEPCHLSSIAGKRTMEALLATRSCTQVLGSASQNNVGLCAIGHLVCEQADRSHNENVLCPILTSRACRATTFCIEDMGVTMPPKLHANASPSSSVLANLSEHM